MALVSILRSEGRRLQRCFTSSSQTLCLKSARSHSGSHLQLVQLHLPGRLGSSRSGPHHLPFAPRAAWANRTSGRVGQERALNYPLLKTQGTDKEPGAGLIAGEECPRLESHPAGPTGNQRGTEFTAPGTSLALTGLL